MARIDVLLFEDIQLYWDGGEEWLAVDPENKRFAESLSGGFNFNYSVADPDVISSILRDLEDYSGIKVVSVQRETEFPKYPPGVIV